MSTFETIDGSVIVPTDPEGHIELRLIGDLVHVQRWEFIRGDVGIASHSKMTCSMRIPLDAVKALEMSTEAQARRAAASE